MNIKEKRDIRKLREKADKIMAHKGNEKGLGIINERDTYLHKVGENGLKEIEKRMERLGYPFYFFELKPFSWYSAGYIPLSIMIARFSLEWSKEEIFSMGKMSAIQSRVLRTAMSLVSMEYVFNNGNRLWRMHFDFGRIEGVEYNQQEQHIRFRLHNYHFGGIMIPYLRGYFTGFMNRVAEERITTTHTSHDPGTQTQAPHDEYLLEW